MTKYPDQNNFRERGFILVYGPRERASSLWQGTHGSRQKRPGTTNGKLADSDFHRRSGEGGRQGMVIKPQTPPPWMHFLHQGSAL